MMQLFYQFETGQLLPAQSCCLDRAMIELPNFSACYEKLKTGYYSTSVYQDVRLKYFIRIFRFELFGSIQESIHEAEL